MRKSASAVAILAALVFACAALADTPADVYSDFAEDGVLSCGHSRAALKGVLKDASLYQYGDPLTFQRLKLAVRKQLAGGCRRARRRPPSRSPDSGNAAEQDRPASESAARPKRKAAAQPKRKAAAQPKRKAAAQPKRKAAVRPKRNAPAQLRRKRSSSELTSGTARAAAPTASSGSSRDGGMILLGVFLLLLTLASGGWAARRAFGRR